MKKKILGLSALLFVALINCVYVSKSNAAIGLDMDTVECLAAPEWSSEYKYQAYGITGDRLTAEGQSRKLGGVIKSLDCFHLVFCGKPNKKLVSVGVVQRHAIIAVKGKVFCFQFICHINYPPAST